MRPALSEHPHCLFPSAKKKGPPSLTLDLDLRTEMNICNKPSNKTAPEKSVWTAPSQDSGPSPELQGQRSRRNGWSWPPHPLQIVAWLLYLFFAVIGFGVLVPLLPHHWVPAGYAVSLEYMGLEKLGRWIVGKKQKPEAGCM